MWARWKRTIKPGLVLPTEVPCGKLLGVKKTRHLSLEILSFYWVTFPPIFSYIMEVLQEEDSAGVVQGGGSVCARVIGHASSWQVVASVTHPAEARAPGSALWEESWCWGGLRRCHPLKEGGEDDMRPLVSPVDEQAKGNAPSPGFWAKESRTCILLAGLLAKFAQMGCLCCTADRDFCIALGVTSNNCYQTCWPLTKIFWKFGFRSQPLIWLHFSWSHFSLACHETEEPF